jgi:hypothetical protein
LIGKPEGTDHLVGLGTDGMTIIKRISGIECWSVLLRIRTAGRLLWTQ